MCEYLYILDIEKSSLSITPSLRASVINLSFLLFILFISSGVSIIVSYPGEKSISLSLSRGLPLKSPIMRRSISLQRLKSPLAYEPMSRTKHLNERFITDALKDGVILRNDLRIF